MILLLVGAALLVAEAYVTTHGLAAIAGAACLVLGLAFFVDRASPDYRFAPGAFTSRGSSGRRRSSSRSRSASWPGRSPARAGGRCSSARRGSSARGRGCFVDIGPPPAGSSFTVSTGRPAARRRSRARVRVVAVDGLTVTVVADASVAEIVRHMHDAARSGAGARSGIGSRSLLVPLIGIAIPVAVILLWFLSGIRIVNEYEQGVVLRLGRFSGTRTAGLDGSSRSSTG